MPATERPANGEGLAVAPDRRNRAGGAESGTVFPFLNFPYSGASRYCAQNFRQGYRFISFSLSAVPRGWRGKGIVLSKRGRPVGDRKGNRVVHRDDGVTEILIVSKAHGDHVALVDTPDWERCRLGACTWSLRRSRDYGFYVETTAWLADGSKGKLGLHTVLTGRLPTDHRNGDGLDNRRCNLRPCTQAQNAKNLRRARNNTSGFTGVFFDRARGNWRACVCSDNKRRYVPGRFATAAEAAVARDVLARELHGDFARMTVTEGSLWRLPRVFRRMSESMLG
jgi:hypothetical protein